MAKVNKTTLEGKFFIFVFPSDSECPWVIRFEDPRMPEGYNEIRVAGWQSTVRTRSFQDEFIEGRLGKYQVHIPDAVMTLNEESNYVIFSRRDLHS